MLAKVQRRSKIITHLAAMPSSFPLHKSAVYVQRFTGYSRLGLLAWAKRGDRIQCAGFGH